MLVVSFSRVENSFVTICKESLSHGGDRLGCVLLAGMVPEDGQSSLVACWDLVALGRGDRHSIILINEGLIQDGYLKRRSSFLLRRDRRTDSQVPCLSVRLFFLICLLFLIRGGFTVDGLVKGNPASGGYLKGFP